MADSSTSESNKTCAQCGVKCSFRNHKWGNIAAYNEGWFFQMDGTAWCPDHTPKWVSKWRASKKPPAM